MECPHLAQSVRLGSNDIEWNDIKNLPFVCAGNFFYFHIYIFTKPLKLLHTINLTIIYLFIMHVLILDLN